MPDAELNRILESLLPKSEQLVQAMAENTQAVTQNTGARGVASTVERVAEGASSWLGGGLAMMPLVGAVVSLFGGGGEKEEPVLTTYSRPEPVRVETNREELAQVTINIQALDSRSFLDHRDEIAQAVRAAMLNSHALNDVVGEL